MSDRDCDNCAHHSEGGCSVWECSFTQKEDDTISRQAAIDAVRGWCQADCTPCEYFPCGEIKAVQALPPAQPNLQQTCNQLATDAISRQAAIDACIRVREHRAYDEIEEIKALPSAQPEKRTEERTETHACDLIDREAAVDAIYHHLPSVSRTEVRLMLHEVSSVQPERTCVNCGRTVNNGGWYADGGTRCPIEEHYALPKDGFCHLWEKRNVTDDDYPERKTNNANIDT